MNQEEKTAQLSQLHTRKNDLQNLLSGSDYKVIKCAEAQAAGLEQPYNASELHAQRQAWRDELNACVEDIERIEAEDVEE